MHKEPPQQTYQSLSHRAALHCNCRAYRDAAELWRRAAELAPNDKVRDQCLQGAAHAEGMAGHTTRACNDPESPDEK
ncbi:MAG TPA: hypothetical protein ENH62_06690 [Marinobacter sp.]|nr:hypothetical protein [Marinobacter sp.]